ncbi:MAG: hypothetical protein ABUL62_18115 [Myxococcales bacterium]
MDALLGWASAPIKAAQYQPLGKPSRFRFTAVLETEPPTETK